MLESIFNDPRAQCVFQTHLKYIEIELDWLKWDEELASPEGQAFLEEMGRELDEARKNGTLIEMGWDEIE